MVIVLVGFGVVAACWRWAWVLAGATATAVAIEHWNGGAYADSGGEIPYSIALIGWLLLFSVVGWLLGAVLRQVFFSAR